MEKYLLATLLLAMVSCPLIGQTDQAPMARKEATFKTHFGDSLIDQYMWLEDRNDPEVLNLLFAENQYLENSLSDTKKFQDHLIDEFESRMTLRSRPILRRIGEYFYYSRQNKRENHPVFYRRKVNGDQKDEVILEVSKIDPGNPFINVVDLSPTVDGDMIAYSVDYLGNEALSVHFKNIKSGVVLDDIIPMASDFSWLKDGESVLYVKRDSLFRPRSVHLHQLGKSADEDIVTYQSQDPYSFVKIEKAASGRYHFLYEYGLEGMEVRFMDSKDVNREWQILAPRDSIHVIANHFNKTENVPDDYFYLYTTKGNKNGRIARVRIENLAQNEWESYLNIEGSPNQRVGIDFNDDQFESYTMLAEYIVLSIEEDASVKFKVVHRNSGESYMIQPPNAVSTSYPLQVENYWENKFQFYHTSFTEPASIYEVDLETRERTKIWQREIKNYDSNDYVAYRIYARSADGTMVPMSVLHQKDVILDGTNPVIIDGYGAAGTYPGLRFNGSPMISLLERGIVYVKTHLRGDGGFGKEWIEDGRRLNKMNTFTDFISCVEHLIDTGYTSSQRIVARGGSAGGLLMGVVANLRPDLFKGLNIQVPVMDLVSFMTNDSMFVVPYLYPEFGNPASEKVYRYIKSYSPYQNMIPQQYPHMLLYSAYNDLRAGYWEATKYVARLRSLKTGNSQILLQTDFNASHDIVGGLKKRLQQTALEFAWYFKVLGIEEDYTKLRGRITDPHGQPLPFSHVGIIGKADGTVANDSGYFELDMRKGDVELTFSHVGYRSKSQSIKKENLNQPLRVELVAESIFLDEVVISSDYENPAREIMNLALERKKEYRKELNSYSAKVYVRSRQYLESLPEKIHPLIGKSAFPDKGIFELSETVSEIHYQRKPRKFRETMVSSINKVRSEIRPFSWHRASNMTVDFYDQLIKLNGQRDIISPLASNAFFYYNFEYHGLQEQGDHSIHKIELKPRRGSDPVFNGHIYIADSTWDLSAIDVVVQPASLRFITAASISQKLLPNDDGFWMPASQNKKLKAKVLGVELLSDDDVLYSDYDINPTFTSDFFQSSSFQIDPAANKKDSSYWAARRPLLITDHEKEFYGNSSSTRNSTRVNRYTFDNLFGGFKSKSRGTSLRELEISGLFQAVNFNTVEGWNADIHVRYGRQVPYTENQKLTFFGNWRYGFSNAKFNARVGTLWDANRSKYRWLKVEAGKYVFQFNELNPITPMVNTFYTLFLRRNYIKLHEKQYGTVSYHSEIKNGLYVFSSLKVEKRNPLVNRTDYSLTKRETPFTANDPQDSENRAPSFHPHHATILQLGIKYQFKQEYEKLGDRRIVKTFNPVAGLTIQKGFEGVLDSEIEYYNIDFFLEGSVDLGILGRSSMYSNYGQFFNKKNMTFIDYKHFNGNRTGLILPHSRRESYFTPIHSFRLLPYYSMSTASEYFQLHFSHHFDGFLVNKLPLVRKADLTSSSGFSFLKNHNGAYKEFYIGLQKTVFQTLTVGIDMVKSINKRDVNESGVRFVIRN